MSRRETNHSARYNKVRAYVIGTLVAGIGFTACTAGASPQSGEKLSTDAEFGQPLKPMSEANVKAAEKATEKADVSAVEASSVVVDTPEAVKPDLGTETLKILGLPENAVTFQAPDDLNVQITGPIEATSKSMNTGETVEAAADGSLTAADSLQISRDTLNGKHGDARAWKAVQAMSEAGYSQERIQEFADTGTFADAEMRVFNLNSQTAEVVGTPYVDAEGNLAYDQSRAVGANDFFMVVRLDGKIYVSRIDCGAVIQRADGINVPEVAAPAPEAPAAPAPEAPAAPTPGAPAAPTPGAPAAPKKPGAPVAPPERVVHPDAPKAPPTVVKKGTPTTKITTSTTKKENTTTTGPNTTIKKETTTTTPETTTPETTTPETTTPETTTPETTTPETTTPETTTPETTTPETTTPETTTPPTTMPDKVPETLPTSPEYPDQEAGDPGVDPNTPASGNTDQNDNGYVPGEVDPNPPVSEAVDPPINAPDAPSDGTVLDPSEAGVIPGNFLAMQETLNSPNSSDALRYSAASAMALALVGLHFKNKKIADLENQKRKEV